jgi:hypothetical protein
VFFCFFGAKIWPAAADTGELGWDLRDPTRNEKVKLTGPNLARSPFQGKSEEWAGYGEEEGALNGGLRRALLWSLAGPRSDTPEHRESGLMSWHGRFGRADVNVCRGAGRCHDSCARGSKDGRMEHQMGADGLLPALRGCHVRRWRWFIKTRRESLSTPKLLA